MHRPCRGSMPLKWHTGRAAGREEESSLTDCSVAYKETYGN